jgi:glycosyltransferase involved in cell wall biosynthesis
VNELNMTNTSKEILLSAIIPIGKMDGNLEILRSWITQVPKYSLRIILIHDIHDKSTGYELEKFMTEYNNLEIMQVSGLFGSPGASRNQGISSVDSKWIAFWDCDDRPLLENIFNALVVSEESDEILVGGFTTRNISGDIISQKHSYNPSMQSVSINPGIWRMIFKFSSVSSLRFESLKLAEDQLYLSDMNFPTRNIKYFKRPFYEYFIGGQNQLTGNSSGLDDLITATNKILTKTSTASSHLVVTFNLTMAIRQQITLIKKGSIRSKVKSVVLIVKFISKSDTKYLNLAFKELIKIFYFARESKLL